MSETTATTVPEMAEHEPVIGSGRARRIYFIIGGLVVVCILGWLLLHFLTAGKETTDDAQVAADIVAVAPRIAGQVVAIHVQENQLVHKGDLVAEIDPRDAEVKVAQAQGDYETAKAQAAEAEARSEIAAASAHGGLQAAQAAVQSSRESVDTMASSINESRAGVTRAEANAQKAANDWKRAEELGGKGDISRAQVDAARAANESAQADLASARAKLQTAINNRQLAEANVQQAQGRLQQSAPVGAQIAAAQSTSTLAHARVRTAQAMLDQAKLALSYTKIFAPADGLASRLAVHAGALVTPGQAIVQLVPLKTYLIANFKETQVKAMRPGQRATVAVDAIGGQEFEGKVESISGGTGASFSLLPPDNASGNYVKVVQRIPVRIAWSGPTADRLPAGSSAEVTVYTK